MKTWAIIRKEWIEVRQNKLILSMILGLPMLFMLMPLVMLYFMARDPGSVSAGDVQMYTRLSPALAVLEPVEVMEIILGQQFMFFFLLMPLFIPIYIAAYSIVGEKTGRSLEPLLAAPIGTGELLAGKSLAAAVPAIVITWVAFVIYAVALRFIVTPAVYAALLSSKWILAMIVIAPLLSVLAMNVAVIISSRVNDVRVAEQLSGLVVLPLIAVAMAQTAGRILFDFRSFVVGAVILALIDIIILYVGVRLFQRETILTRWR
ncbi:MAG: ABC transporter permease subunit [Anaerolineae bacterium]